MISPSLLLLDVLFNLIDWSDYSYQYLVLSAS